MGVGECNERSFIPEVAVADVDSDAKPAWAFDIEVLKTAHDIKGLHIIKPCVEAKDKISCTSEKFDLCCFECIEAMAHHNVSWVALSLGVVVMPAGMSDVVASDAMANCKVLSMVKSDAKDSKTE